MSGTPSALLNLGVPLRSATPLSATLEPVDYFYILVTAPLGSSSEKKKVQAIWP